MPPNPNETHGSILAKSVYPSLTETKDDNASDTPANIGAYTSRRLGPNISNLFSLEIKYANAPNITIL